MLRDPGGVHRLSPDPPAPEERIAVCPDLVLPPAPDQPISGDFARHIATLGSSTPHSPAEMLALFGAPLSPVVTELTGDCRHTTSVLYTERQRLELHPGEEWPYRIVGTRIGTEIYKQRYGVTQVEPRQDITGDAIANERFRAFFERYGGLPVFGYPISAELVEVDAATRQSKRVQYFERARFELVADAPEAAPLLEQVQLGLLGREYAGIVAQCGTPLVRISPPSAQSAQPSAHPAAVGPAATEHLPPNAVQSGQVPTTAPPATALAEPAGITSRSGGWLLLLAFLVTLFNVGFPAVRRYRR